jgi:UDP-N-acetylmuramate: L-alanyl-gamma-D-glutamyl-meso-diaminopimelate ligase
MNVHFIAIGGSAMHNLALALHQQGHQVSGSDDEIFEPSRSRLATAGLLPPSEGWHVERIHKDLDAVILGMHARSDNPELIRAQSLGLPIFSYPEFLYEQTRQKTRVVIGGSHGKTTITSMVLHVLKQQSLDFDFMVGALLDGYDCSVRLSEKSGLAIFEGDEYLSSPIDRRPKFHLYRPNIALISGIAWDHMNVFPSFANYLEQFSIFIDRIESGGTLIYCADDDTTQQLVAGHPRVKQAEIDAIEYRTPEYTIDSGSTLLNTPLGSHSLQLFGAHNLQNLEGARMVCARIGIADSDFYAAIATFTGASQRLEKMHESDECIVFRDFAHAPSKVRATVQAVRAQYPDHRLLACLELHTYSSLNHAFLPHYKDALQGADRAIVYYSPEVVKRKRLEAIEPSTVKAAFNRDDLEVTTTPDGVQTFIDGPSDRPTVILLMSSGNWGGGIQLNALP